MKRRCIGKLIKNDLESLCIISRYVDDEDIHLLVRDTETYLIYEPLNVPTRSDILDCLESVNFKDTTREVINKVSFGTGQVHEWTFTDTTHIYNECGKFIFDYGHYSSKKSDICFEMSILREADRPVRYFYPYIKFNKTKEAIPLYLKDITSQCLSKIPVKFLELIQEFNLLSKLEESEREVAVKTIDRFISIFKNRRKL